MEVTIAIINYNYGRYLRQAIESALNQKIDIAYEVLVIDDGSTDISDDIMNDFKDVLNFRISKTANQGFAKSLSRAVTEANGKYLFLMDADDYFAEDKVKRLLPFLQEGLLYIADTSTYINEEGKVIIGNATGSTSTIAVNRNAALSLTPLENELSFYSFFMFGRGKILEESHTYYRFHNNSMTNRKIAGKQQDYLAGITFNLSDALNKLAADNVFMRSGINRFIVKRVANYFKSQAYYNMLEAALERKQYIAGYKYCFMMFYWSIKGRKLNVLYFKMIIKTILGRPSFPKPLI